MTKRRLIIALLSVVATGTTVAMVPWVIVEWYVYRIATDRGALVAALEAPEGTWRWRALEEYAVRPDGENALRLELVTALCEMVDSDGRTHFSKPVDSGERAEQRWRFLVRLADTWGIVGVAGEDVVTVCGSLRPTASTLKTARVRIGEK